MIECNTNQEIGSMPAGFVMEGGLVGIQTILRNLLESLRTVFQDVLETEQITSFVANLQGLKQDRNI